MASSSSSGGGLQRFFSQPLSVQWQTAIVRLPRAVPLPVLKYTNPDGPFPFIFNLTSRNPKRQIPLYIFIAPSPPPSSQPESNGNRSLDLPVVIDFHGGGFFMGSALEQAPFCAKLARDTGAVVLSVDYRMGPIDKFPAAYEDAEDTLSAIVDPAARGYDELRQAVSKYVQKTLRKQGGDKKTCSQVEVNLDASRVGISGFSSGGNLALNMALNTPLLQPGDQKPDAWPSRFPSSHPRPIPLLVYYPSLDCRKLPSQRPRPANLPVGSKWWSGVNDALHPTYLPDEHSSHPRGSPGLADVTTMLHPKARVQLVLAEMDTLTEQGEVWTRMMQDQGRGADVQLEKYMGMSHG